MMLKIILALSVICPFKISIAITKCVTHPDNGRQKCIEVSASDLELIQQANYTYAGHSFDWSDTEDGWNDYRRLNLLEVLKNHDKNMAKIPKYHSIGYEKLKIPTQLYQRVQNLKMPETLINEECGQRKEIINCARIGPDNLNIAKENTQLYSFKSPNLILQSVQKYLKPILENWAKVKLNPESLKVHGVRRYLENSKVFPHVDATTSHIFGAILQIEQKLDQNWPICLIGRKQEFQCFDLQPGEMLIYESATIIHCRPWPLKGHFYDIFMVHYAPQIKDEF